MSSNKNPGDALQQCEVTLLRLGAERVGERPGGFQTEERIVEEKGPKDNGKTNKEERRKVNVRD